MPMASCLPTRPMTTPSDDPTNPNANPKAETGVSWIVRILPQLEENALSKQFEPALRGYFQAGAGLMDPRCRTALKTQMQTLHCPSDSSSLVNSTNQYELEGIEVALGNYKGSIGDDQIGGTSSVHQGSMPDCHRTRNCPGFFWRHRYLSPINFKKVTDGLSHTFMVGEDVPAQNWHSCAFFGNGCLRHLRRPAELLSPSAHARRVVERDDLPQPAPQGRQLLHGGRLRELRPGHDRLQALPRPVHQGRRRTGSTALAIMRSTRYAIWIVCGMLALASGCGRALEGPFTAR